MKIQTLENKSGKLGVYISGIRNDQIAEAFKKCFEKFTELRPKEFNPITKIGIWDMDYGDILPSAFVAIKER